MKIISILFIYLKWQIIVIMAVHSWTFGKTISHQINGPLIRFWNLQIVLLLPFLYYWLISVFAIRKNGENCHHNLLKLKMMSYLIQPTVTKPHIFPLLSQKKKKKSFKLSWSINTFIASANFQPHLMVFTQQTELGQDKIRQVINR